MNQAGTSGGVSQGEPLRVLAADDSATARQHLQGVLERLGHQALSASDGPRLLELLGQEEVDLILCDLMMPGMDGLEVLASARSLKPGIPFIIITSHGSLDSAVEALRQGADDYLAKPVEAELLAHRMAAALSKRQLEASQRERAKLEAALATAGAAAHQINQPLTTLLATAQLMENCQDPARNARYCRIIATQSQRLGDIVHRLVNLTRFKTVAYPGNTEILDLDLDSEKDS
ncbi:MAG: response regulator [Desulfarculaceae bacterium]|nr:response regulator [Desulfarculaceae bacterium]MCF8072567.1 response regulator [Desulfarculaceae bacterium]MCF8103470.1 response regulator [Desulfarculaceae bacterium]MCF8117512.1 response regulator [Desulfarculaceae bacterium]